MAAIPYPVSGAGVMRRLIASPVAASRRIHYGAEVLDPNSGRDDSDGQPTPCLRVGGSFSLRFRIGVLAGVRTITVQAKQTNAGEPRPVLMVAANSDVGLDAPLLATAPAGAGWVTVGPVTFTATVAGAIEVELRNPSGFRPCQFDNLLVA